jgi:uncharacterized protein
VPAPAEPLTPEAPPLPGRVLTTQHWRDLAFLHWAVEPSVVAPFLPRRTRPDTFEGRTYVGLVPFRMVGLTLGRVPVPHFGTFLETNVRLYSVDDRGRRGVVFCSLDVDRRLVSPAIRLAIGAPYRFARMGFAELSDGSGDTVTYDHPESRVRLRVGPAREATPLEIFLTARWAAHVRRTGRTTYVRNRHDPWPLQDAEVLELDDHLVAREGFPGLSDRAPDHVAFSRGVFSEFSRPVRV